MRILLWMETPCISILHFNFPVSIPIFADPRSSLLSIGRVPQVNFLMDYGLHDSLESPLLDPAPYQLSCINTWAQPMQVSRR